MADSPSTAVLALPEARRRRLGPAGWVLLTPLIFWCLAFIVAPTAIMLFLSFCTQDEFGVDYTLTLHNYRRLIASDYLGVFAGAAVWGALAGAVAGAFIFFSGAARADFDPRTRRRRPAKVFFWFFVAAAAFYLHCRIPDLDEDATYLKIFWTSIEYAGLTTLICLLAGYPVAYLVGRSAPRRRSRLLLLIMIPFWTSFLIRTYAWLTILKQEGVLNGVLKWIGVIPHLIASPLQLAYTPTAVIIGLVYAYLPFMILPIFGSVEKMDGSLLEAALDLGSTPWRAFWRVILPLTAPGIAAGVLLVFVPAIGMFAVTALLGNGKVLLVGDVIANQYGQARNLPFGAALAMAMVLLLGLAYAVAAALRGRSN